MNMRRKNRAIRSVAFLAAIVTCLALGVPDAAVGGIQGSGFRLLQLIGKITGFGSIYVNGVEYSTAHANVVIDGRAGTESELKAGQIVALEGTVNDDGRTGEATQVEFFGDVVGPVTRVNPPKHTFEVLGQTVRVSADTLFGGTALNADLDGLVAGEVVEVSGFADSHGELMAARVDAVPAAVAPQVRGKVGQVQVKAQSFQINGLEVDYRGAAVEGQLKNGATAKVQGRLAGSVLLATRVVVPAAESQTGARGEVEGIVTSFESASVFEVNEQPVVTTSKTKLSLHGQALGPDLPVTVEGDFDPAGTLVASKVTLKPHSSAVVNGRIEAIDGNQLRVAGRGVRLSDSTIFEDRSSLHLRTLTADELRLGDYVQVTGASVNAGVVLASTLQRDDPPGPGPHEKKRR